MSKTKLSFWSLIAEAIRLLKPVTRLAWPELAWLAAAHLVVTQYDGLATNVLRARGREDVSLIIISSMITLILQALLGAAMLLVVSITSRTVLESPAPTRALINFPALFREHYFRLLIEGLRALAAIVVRLPLLILPALIEWVRLGFVQYIVVFDSAYQKGEVDALRESRKLSSGHFWFLSGIYSVGPTLGIIIYLFGSADAELLIWKKPAQTLIVEAFSFATELFTAILIYATYRKIAQATTTPES